MKAKHFIPVFLCLAGLPSFAQQQPLSNPDKKSTTIIITFDSIAPTDAYRKAAQVLMDAGYQLNKTDETLHILQTDWGEQKGFMLYQVQLDINVRKVPHGSELRLSGSYRYKSHSAIMDEYSTGKIEYRTNAGKYWDELDRVALLLGGQQYGFL